MNSLNIKFQDEVRDLPRHHLSSHFFLEQERSILLFEGNMHLPSRYDQSRSLLHQSFFPRTKLPSSRVISQHTLTLQSGESKKLITILL